MGGQAAGPVPQDGHDFAIWEKRVDALMVLLSGLATRSSTRPSAQPLRWLGPAVLALVLAALTTVTLMRSAPMDYPDLPRGLEPITITAPVAEPLP